MKNTLLAMCLVLFTTSASADMVTFTYTGTGLGQGESYQLNGNNLSSFAGQLHWTTPSAPGTFTSFCTEITQTINSGANVYNLTALGNSTTDKELKELFGRFYSSVDTNDEASAFQIAVWEIKNDPTHLDLYHDNFRYTQNDNVQQIANNWLASLDGNSTYFNTNLSYMTNGSSQDQVIIYSPVPEPSTFALLGLAGVGAFVWYRKKKQNES